MFVCAGGRSLPSHVIPVTTAAVVLTCLGFASVVGLSDSLPFVFLENSFFLSTSLHIHFGPFDLLTYRLPFLLYLFSPVRCQAAYWLEEATWQGIKGTGHSRRECENSSLLYCVTECVSSHHFRFHCLVYTVRELEQTIISLKTYRLVGTGGSPEWMCCVDMSTFMPRIHEDSQAFPWSEYGCWQICRKYHPQVPLRNGCTRDWSPTESLSSGQSTSIIWLYLIEELSVWAAGTCPPEHTTPLIPVLLFFLYYLLSQPSWSQSHVGQGAHLWTVDGTQLRALVERTGNLITYP